MDDILKALIVGTIQALTFIVFFLLGVYFSRGLRSLRDKSDEVELSHKDGITSVDKEKTVKKSNRYLNSFFKPKD